MNAPLSFNQQGNFFFICRRNYECLIRHYASFEESAAEISLGEPLIAKAKLPSFFFFTCYKGSTTATLNIDYGRVLVGNYPNHQVSEGSPGP